MNKCWCGNEELREYSENYYQCDKCHTLISKHDFKSNIYDVKDEETDLYGKNYWQVSMAKAAGKNTLSEVIDMYLAERVIYWLKFILRYVKLGADIAEVGCGLGQLQYVMKRLGYHQKAYELSQEICDYMEKELKIQVHCGSFEKETNSYDGILAFDLFEHLMQPDAFLENCADSLRENGVLCFQTPRYDPELTYEQMKEKKPKFMEQLRTEQHIYLFSKESMTEILQKHGFRNIVFEPAYFGDDYDMFLFASKDELKTNTDSEIDSYLNSMENGRLLKAMITLFDENRKLTARFEEADRDRNERLKSINTLTYNLKESEADRTNRLKEIEQLTAWLKESQEKLSICLKQKEENLDITDIERLKGALQESEADRAARMEQINKLTVMLKECETDRAARMEQINKLTATLQESETDRAARMKQIDRLTAMLKECETDRAARMKQMSQLTEMLKNSEADHARHGEPTDDIAHMNQDTESEK